MHFDVEKIYLSMISLAQEDSERLEVVSKTRDYWVRQHIEEVGLLFPELGAQLHQMLSLKAKSLGDRN